jgi:transposase
MDDVKDDAKSRFRRIEVLTGPGRRRQWPATEKARVVAESLEPGAAVTDVARRWQICPQQVFGWRRQARAGLLALPSSVAGQEDPGFVPIMAEAASAADAMPTARPPRIEIELAGAVVRIPPGMDEVLLMTVLRAVRASAA